MADVGVGALIASSVALAAVPFAIALPLPALVGVWVVSTIGRSIAPVHQHCHAHYKIFGNAFDHVYDAILLLAAGNTTAVWEQQHVRGHHQHYLERDGDPANNDRFGRGRLHFTIVGDAHAFTDSLRIARGDRAAIAKLWLHFAMQLAIVIAAFVVDPVLAIAFVVVPWLLLRWFVFWFSYAQHDSVPMTDVYSGSVTHFGWTNAMYLNVGHHTAHHEKPTLHWTRLPARTAQIVERIPSTCLR
jgi:hypothetical protein